MKKQSILLFAMFAFICNHGFSQTFENQYTRSLSDIMSDVAKRFNIRLKYDMDTTGLKVKYADFRVRPYSVEETLTNILSPLDFKAVYQNKNIWKVKNMNILTARLLMVQSLLLTSLHYATTKPNGKHAEQH